MVSGLAGLTQRGSGFSRYSVAIVVACGVTIGACARGCRHVSRSRHSDGGDCATAPRGIAATDSGADP